MMNDRNILYIRTLERIAENSSYVTRIIESKDNVRMCYVRRAENLPYGDEMIYEFEIGSRIAKGSFSIGWNGLKTLFSDQSNGSESIPETIKKNHREFMVEFSKVLAHR